VIHCGVDAAFRPAPPSGILRHKLGLSPEAFLVVYYGRPGLTKGVDVLLRAAPLLPNAHLALILADEPRPQYLALRRLVADLPNVTLLPSLPRAELIEHLLDASCVVVPSRTEGFGLTAAESCALGLPVVATTAGSLPEVVSGRHVLVEPGSPSALAEGILRVQRGEWIETPLKTFPWKTMVAKYEQLYREVLECA
jgi:glycosyltransferase involved in cell wall biosynthesis